LGRTGRDIPSRVAGKGAPTRLRSMYAPRHAPAPPGQRLRP
jgi:hypothetical protein